MELKKTAVTAYGLIGFDWIRMTVARLADQSFVFVRADGSNAIVSSIPSMFRTSGDIANVVSTLGHRVNLAAVPSVGLPNHEWKGTYSLTEIVEKFEPKRTALIVDGLTATYADQIAA